MRFRVVSRIVWALLSAFAVESLVFGLAVLPAVTFWEWHSRWPVQPPWVRTVLLSMAFIPAYIIFAVVLMVLSAATSRLFGWRTPVDAELRLDEAPRPLLDWARYGISTQLVRIFAGPLFRSTPVWAYYMRLNGAKLGRRVYVNSLRVTDHNLLDFDDDVVIGGDVHLSGHTVERGVLKTARVRLGRGVTVGVGSVVSIGVEAGDGCQIGALSFVPKFSKLEANGIYVGTPVRKLEGR
ncbi:MAG TPA: hypothetical protein VEK15_00150 [Vicinamibacteria bacterium]|nr:hypothetical protein [Vicinamibacteria bacterium]